MTFHFVLTLLCRLLFFINVVIRGRLRCVILFNIFKYNLPFNNNCMSELPIKVAYYSVISICEFEICITGVHDPITLANRLILVCARNEFLWSVASSATVGCSSVKICRVDVSRQQMCSY